MQESTDWRYKMKIQNGILVRNTENLAFYEMFCMQHTLLRAKIIFLKSEMGCRSIKYNLYYENSLKQVY